jgi:ferric-dicitrate binding protein FerR (iron transport regulator)
VKSRASRSRHLWVNGRGNFKTRGKRASAIVRGTQWLTSDSPVGTRVAVSRGAVSVRDLVLKRTIFLTAGHSYTAKPRRVVAHRRPAFTGSV